jgi:hypothetical protein
MSCEIAAADYIAAKNFLLFTMIADHTLKQMFNLNERGLFRKHTPRHTFTSMEENMTAMFKVTKDKCTLLLGSNAPWDYNLRSLSVSVIKCTDTEVTYKNKTACCLEGN